MTDRRWAITAAAFAAVADPTEQWTEFVGGFPLADRSTRIGRPTAIALGAQGSLFIADDQNGFVYRVRPM